MLSSVFATRIKGLVLYVEHVANQCGSMPFPKRSGSIGSRATAYLYSTRELEITSYYCMGAYHVDQPACVAAEVAG